MKYAWKNADNKIRVMNVVSGDPAQFLPEGATLIGPVPSELDGVKHLKLDVDEITLIEDADEVAAQAVRSAALLKAEKGKKFKELASQILHIIAGHNHDNGLDMTQIASLKTDHPEAFALLSDGQPYSAKSYIDAITPDGTIITQEELDHVAEAYAMFAEANPDLVPA